VVSFMVSRDGGRPGRLVATLLAQAPQDKTGRSQDLNSFLCAKPHFVPAGRPIFLKDTDRGVGVSENGVSKLMSGCDCVAPRG